MGDIVEKSTVDKSLPNLLATSLEFGAIISDIFTVETSEFIAPLVIKVSPSLVKVAFVWVVSIFLIISEIVSFEFFVSLSIPDNAAKIIP